MTKPEKLFEPIKIGKLQLKNRIVMPALNSKLGTEFGAVSDRLIDFYVERLTSTWREPKGEWV
jgi:2,4-dienoyl-CoA reductase-like NADH-dependent reductase (Old Yellow Enzyme family)